MCYSASSQKNNWTFQSEEEISEIMDSVYSSTGNLLTIEECKLVVSYYERQIFNEELTKLPRNILFVCCLMYKHFFLVQSPQLFNPKTVMVACISLGRKLEEFRYKNETDIEAKTVCDIMSEKLHVSSEELQLWTLYYEPVVLEVLHFEIQKFNAWEPFEGIERLMKILNKKPENEIKQVKISEKKCFERMKKMYSTNVPLLKSPSFIAFTVIYSTLDDNDKNEFLNFIDYFKNENEERKKEMDIDKEEMERIIDNYGSFEITKTTRNIVTEAMEKIKQIERICILSLCSLDEKEPMYIPMMKKMNGRFILKESSVVQLHQKDNKHYQFWCPLGEITNAWRQCSRFIPFQSSVILLFFDVSVADSFEQFKKCFYDITHSYNNIRYPEHNYSYILVGVHSELQHAVSDGDIEQFIKELKINDNYSLNIKYMNWDNEKSTADDIINLIEEIKMIK